MNRGFLLGVGLFLFAGAAIADSEYQPPAVGTQITWLEPTREGGRKSRVSKVVAQGDDFAIYLYDISYDVDKPTSYFAEFSGIHISSCGYAMPTAQERESLRKFWPLQPGKSLQIGSEDALQTTYEVGQRTVHAISQIDGERPAQYVSATDGEFRTNVMVSLDWGTPVLMGWDDGENARAIEMFSPTIPAGPLEANRVSLGECAGLLEE